MSEANTEPTTEQLAADAKAAIEAKKTETPKPAKYVEPPHTERLCPILNMGALKGQEDERMIIAMGEHRAGQTPRGFTAVPCQGAGCMWFFPVLDEHGNFIKGGCAVSTSTTLQMAVGNALGNTLGILAHRAKIKMD